MAEPLHRRTSASTGASISRQSRASRIQKSWILDEEHVGQAAVEDAAQAGLQQQEALQIVRRTTRFATVMCVVIAIVKITIYLQTGAEVVRTSALDSLGDLMANMITLYTGYRMSQVDTKKYPAGQGKFQSIGCLVFSTLMFALMFGNAIGNVESLIEGKDDVGHAAISRFFHQTAAVPEFSDWQNDLELNEDSFVWKVAGADKIPNPIQQYFRVNGTEEEKVMAASMEALVTRGTVVKLAAEYENEAEKWSELKLQNFFLGCCASYKCCLWLFCLYYAIPKSGSSVLVALATDKRNDFIATSFVIVTTFSAALFLQGYEELEAKADPMVSLVLSFFIMFTWCQLMVEHITLLSQEAAPLEFRDGIESEVRALVKDDAPCTADSSDIKVYNSGLGYTVEVTLVPKSEKTSCGEACALARALRSKLEELEDVERVMTFTSLPSSSEP